MKITDEALQAYATAAFGPCDIEPGHPDSLGASSVRTIRAGLEAAAPLIAAQGAP